MGGNSQAGSAGTIPKKWRPLAVLGGLTVLAGLIVPQVLPAGTAAPDPTPSASASPSNNKLTYTPPAWPEPPNHGAMLLRLGLGTCLVLGLCAGTLWGCKRWLRSTTALAQGGGQLKLIETLSLGNRGSLFLVHVGKRPVLIGADCTGVRSVVALPDSFSQTLLESPEPAVPGEEANGFPANQ